MILRCRDYGLDIKGCGLLDIGFRISRVEEGTQGEGIYAIYG